MKKRILALTIATLSIGAYANTYDADKTNYAANTSQNPDAVAHAKAMVGVTTNGEAKVYASDATAYGDSRTYAGYRGTATGANTVANGEGAVATGYSSTASGIVSIAHGSDAKATGDGSIATGAEASAEGARATAIGRGAIGKGAGATALGSAAQATGTSSVAVGPAATASDTRSVAVGANANADGHRATALGTNAKASGPGAVALGNESEAVNQKLWNRTNESAVIDGVMLDGWAGTKNYGEVSIGTKDKERAISNVAAAEISKTSTEAVNGSQLYSVVKKVAENKQSVKLAHDRLDEHDNAILANSTAIENHEGRITNNADRLNSVEQTQTAHDVLIRDNTANIDALTKRADANDIVDAQQWDKINSNSKSIGDNVLSINNNTKDIVANKAGVNSNKQAISANKQAISANKQAIETNKQAIETNKQAIETNAKNIGASASQINANRAKIDKLSNGIAQANKRIDSLSDDVRKHRKLASAGIASAFAVANIPHATYAGKSALGVGVGGHGGQQALAVRYSRLSDNTKWLVSVSGGLDTQSQVTYGAGLTYQFQ